MSFVGKISSVFYRELRNIYCKCYIHWCLYHEYSLSAFHWELKNIYIICHYHRRNIVVGIVPAKIIFFIDRNIPSVKSSVFFFNRISDIMWNYRRMLCRRTVSVEDLVGKKFTNKLAISHLRILSFPHISWINLISSSVGISFALFLLLLETNFAHIWYRNIVLTSYFGIFLRGNLSLKINA